MTNTFAPNNGLKWNIDKLNITHEQGTGVVSGTGVSVVESAKGWCKLVFPITDLSITMTDATTAGSHGKQKFFTFPEGAIVVAGTITNLTVSRVGTAIGATAAVVGSIGSATVSTADSTLTGTEADVVPSTAVTLTAGAGVFKGHATTVPKIDGTTAPASLWLNFAIPDAGSTGNDALLVNGTITVVYMNIGDH